MNKHNESICSQQKSNITSLALWTLAWVISTAFLRFGAEYIWDYQPAYSIIALITHLALGLTMIMVNVKHLANLDELQRKITLDAMGITLGVGLIAGIAYEQLEDIKLISFEPEISHLIMLMAFTYILSILIGNRKYQ
ncbi:hypothetical protein [Paraglaciecola arctica]|uniref:Membrane protein n=1 Tax=Paraglaciecola arctica BSs20135 TaxID=493475 RepID=K6YSM2_9ALTE|nr:hypothetical protein [Paraglaciecola arctica]GAC19693.1 membrane protein [Paraglaciecola arctica BSs20135]